MATYANPNLNFQLRINVCEAFGLQKADKTGNADPFVVAKLRGKFWKGKVQTSQIKQTLEPVWNQELMLYPKNISDILVLKIYDHDTLRKDNFLGMVEVPLERFFQQGMKDSWLQLMRKKQGWKRIYGKRPSYISAPGQLHVQIWFGNMNEFNNMLATSGFANQSMNQSGSMLNQSGSARPKWINAEPKWRSRGTIT